MRESETFLEALKGASIRGMARFMTYVVDGLGIGLGVLLALKIWGLG